MSDPCAANLQFEGKVHSIDGKNRIGYANGHKDANNKIFNLTLVVLKPGGGLNHHLQNSQECACQETKAYRNKYQPLRVLT